MCNVRRGIGLVARDSIDALFAGGCAESQRVRSRWIDGRDDSSGANEVQRAEDCIVGARLMPAIAPLRYCVLDDIHRAAGASSSANRND